jgi:hypothetical protein
MSDDDTVIDLDFGQVVKQEAMPEGDYLLQITDCQAKKSKNDPTAWVLHNKYEVLEPAEFAGRKIRDWVYIAPDPADQWGIQNFLAAVMDVDPDEVTGVKLNPQAIVAETVGASLRQEEMEKEKRTVNKVAAYFRPSNYTG